MMNKLQQGLIQGAGYALPIALTTAGIYGIQAVKDAHKETATTHRERLQAKRDAGEKQGVTGGKR